MTELESMIAVMNGATSVNEKNQFISYFANMASHSTLGKKERDLLSTLAERELSLLLSALETSNTYREKNDIIGYANSLMDLALALYHEPTRIPSSLLTAVMQLSPVLKETRFLENEIDAIFEKDAVNVGEIEHLGETLATVTDEYQRGLLWSGCLHYAEKLSTLPADSKAALHQLFVSEFSRLFTLSLTEDVLGSIEVAADLMKYSLADDTVSLLHKAIALGEAGISYYALSSLIEVTAELDSATVAFLANDLEYAALTYSLLKDHGKASLFPSELATPEYLAKSDLVHWLVYPTELGKQPDEIEYIGTTVIEKIPYYFFRFRSDSDTLDNDVKGKWLVGWSADEGNTFSDFELYDDFADKSPEKTLKKLKKHILS